MFKAYGIVEVRKGVRINLNLDFIRYYRALYNFYTYQTVKNQLPMYGAHISVILPAIHKGVDFLPAIKYNRNKVEFEYDPKSVFISKKNVWMNVKCEWAEKLKKELGIVENNFWGYHLTICNFKNENSNKI